MNQLDLFSGIGGFSLAGEWVWGKDHHIHCFIETDLFCQKVLKKHWPDVLIHDDMRTYHAWDIDENDKICYCHLCDQKNNKKLVSKISKKLKRQKQNEELLKFVEIAEQRFLFPEALLIEKNVNGDFVHGNAETNLCEEIVHQIQGADNGCEEKEIQTGKVDMVTIEGKGIKRQKYLNGEEEFSQEINILVSSADASQKKEDSSGRIILNRGQSVLKKDLISQMALPCVKNATTKSIIPPCKRLKRGQIDLLTAGIPCQPASVAGKRRGSQDDRWLWPEALRIVREFRPRWIIFENVYGFITLSNGVELDKVLSDLEDQGYETQTFIIPACGVDAPHRRDRVWIVAYSKGKRLQGSSGKNGTSNKFTRNGATNNSKAMADAESVRLQRKWKKQNNEKQIRLCSRETGREANCWLPEPPVGRVAHGVPQRVDRLRSLGNAIVPQVVMPIMEGIKMFDK